MISIRGLNKTYPQGFCALKDINLDIVQGEIFALLGPNGAGKTTLISTICGLNTPSTGQVSVGGHDIIKQFREARSMIGLVPQEIALSVFETVWDNVSFTRGLFGKKADPNYIEQILRDLSLWEKKDNMLLTLSGGMKRRVMIAKALSHEPKILFLDEPTAGVDVELRRDMWKQVAKLRDKGVTIILTTHYIEEAEEMADRVGVIQKGEIQLVENTKDLMKKLGTKLLSIELAHPMDSLADDLTKLGVSLEQQQLKYRYDSRGENNGVAQVFEALKARGIEFSDISTDQSTLEEIFVELVRKQ